MERITVELINSKEFSIETRGYNRKEVDEFLDEICDEMERMEKELNDLKQNNAVVREALAAKSAFGASDENEKSLREVLEMAIRVSLRG